MKRRGKRWWRLRISLIDSSSNAQPSSSIPAINAPPQNRYLFLRACALTFRHYCTLQIWTVTSEGNVQSIGQGQIHSEVAQRFSNSCNVSKSRICPPLSQTSDSLMVGERPVYRTGTNTFGVNLNSLPLSASDNENNKVGHTAFQLTFPVPQCDSR